MRSSRLDLKMYLCACAGMLSITGSTEPWEPLELQECKMGASWNLTFSSAQEEVHFLRETGGEKKERGGMEK